MTAAIGEVMATALAAALEQLDREVPQLPRTMDASFGPAGSSEVLVLAACLRAASAPGAARSSVRGLERIDRLAVRMHPIVLTELQRLRAAVAVAGGGVA